MSQVPPKSFSEFVLELELTVEVNSLLKKLSTTDRIDLVNNNPRFDWVVDYIEPMSRSPRIPPPNGIVELRKEVARITSGYSSPSPPPKKDG